MAANGNLSDWTALPILVNKDKDADIQGHWLELRMTINYGKVEEDLSGTNLPLLADLHTHLSDPRIGSMSKFDLKFLDFHGFNRLGCHKGLSQLLIRCLK